jgi:integrase/recombinase XerD
MWFRWLTRSHRILSNPAADLDMPRMERRLPKHILSAEEADRILNGVDMNEALGVRDRAILETLYSTGIRRMELCNLHLHDIDYDRGTLMVRQGKGKRDRLLPIGDRALAWIAKYRDEVRPAYALADDEGCLFIGRRGEKIGTDRLSRLVRAYVDRAQINKIGSCHLFRHTMATLMLENGADIRYIQIMLGHEELTTTQLYTQVAILKLKELHTLTHPARLERVGSCGVGGDNTAEFLLAVLDEEAKEDDE